MKLIQQKPIENIWKIRTVKYYPEAHNHIIVGKVLEIHDSHVRLQCKTYHFGRNVNDSKDISVGQEMIRIIPWNRIEIINELPSSFNYVNAQIQTDNSNNLFLREGNYKCSLCTVLEKRY